MLTSWGLRRILRSPQFWLVLGLAAAIPAVYYFIGMPGGAGNYLSVWTLPYLHLLKDVYFYVRWLQKLHSLFNLTFLVAGVVGLALLPKPGRALVSGLWIGYVITGLMVPSLIRSHSYYNLQLVPTVALSLGPLAQVVFKRLAKISIPWQAIMIAALLVGLGDAVIWDHKEISTVDYRSEPAFWKDLGSKLPGGRLIGLSEDYNTRIQYYGWRFVAQYPYSYDQAMDREAGGSFDVNADNWSYFLERTNGYDYFLVTVLDEFDAQPYLKKILYGYYPIVMQGDRYVLFDLRHPIKPIPSGG
jgi:hypothetical protein